MQQQLRKSEDRGFANHGWLKSRHTFSFADYYDPKHMGFRSLRVLNEDRIEGGSGFSSHGHKSMEIISYVVKGALQHQDSMGTKAIIKPGEVQKMSAGDGIVHSEHNAIADAETHFFQIWVQPKTPGGVPGYEQKSFEEQLNSKKIVLVLSENAREDSLAIKQDADLYISRLKAGDEVEFKLREGRGAWIQVVKGKVTVKGKEISTGDAVNFQDSELLSFKALDHSELMIFDLA